MRRTTRARSFLPLLLTVLLVLAIAGILLYAFRDAPETEARLPLQLIFFDVGQGDAALIRTPEGRTALIDGGRSRAAVTEFLQALAVERLDLVIASHADADHIGGLVQAVELFRPRFFMDNGVPHTTQTYQNLLVAVSESGATYLEADERTLGLGGAELFILPPPRLNQDQNENSVGVVLTHDGFRAHFSGDATHRSQRIWLENYQAELAGLQVYKSAHHGARTGDQADYMSALEPEVVVISVGADNPYGHPTEEALASYAAAGATVYRTDLHGHITVSVLPGGAYTVTTGALPDWQPILTRPPSLLERLERFIMNLLQ